MGLYARSVVVGFTPSHMGICERLREARLNKKTVPRQSMGSLFFSLCCEAVNTSTMLNKKTVPHQSMASCFFTVLRGSQYQYHPQDWAQSRSALRHAGRAGQYRAELSKWASGPRQLEWQAKLGSRAVPANAMSVENFYRSDIGV